MDNKEREKLIEDWIEKNEIKRYQHGERPEGEVPCSISAWGRNIRLSDKKPPTPQQELTNENW